MSTTHVLEVRAAGWAIEHPLTCRENGRSLLDCPVHLAAQALRQSPRSPGRYEARAVDGSLKIGKRAA